MNLVDALAGDYDVDYGALTTYPFDPYFFNRFAIGALRDAGVSQPVVLMDGPTYQDKAKTTDWGSAQIGDGYYLEPVTIDQVFHPKVSLCASEDALSFAVGSANMTLNEYTTAAQLTTSNGLERTTRVDDPERAAIVQIARGIRHFFEYLASEHVTGEDATTQLNELLRASSWITDIDTHTAPNAWFFDNTTTPILTQVSNHVGEVDRATLFAPFYGSGQSLRKIATTLNSDELVILVAEDVTHINHEDIQTTLDTPVEFRQVNVESNRWVHAKFLLLEGPWGSSCLTGSPNMSAAALTTTAENGNLEAGILRVEDQRQYFGLPNSAIFNSNHFSITPGESVDPGTLSLATRNPYPDRSSTRPALSLIDAQYRSRTGTDQLKVTLTGLTSPNDGTISAIHRDLNVTCTFEPDEDGTVTEQVKISSAWKNALLRVSLNDGRSSTVRQATGEPTPFASEAGSAMRTGGRSGMRPLVDALLFGNQRAASQTLSMTTDSIQDRLEAQAADPDTDIETGEIDRSERKWGERGGGGQSSQARKPHLHVKDVLSLAIEQLHAELERNPTPDGAERLIDYLETFWSSTERALLRYHIEQQRTREEDLESVILDIDADALHSVLNTQLSTLIDTEILPRTSHYLTTVLSTNEARKSDIFPRRQAFDQLFSGPAAVLTISNHADTQLVEPYRFTHSVFKAFTECHPYIAECLLDPAVLHAGIDEKYQQYHTLIQTLRDETPLQPTLPNEHDYGVKLLTHIIWCSEISTYDTNTGGYARFDPNTSIFALASQCDRYDDDALQQVGQLAVAGQNHVTEIEGLETGLLAPLPDRRVRHQELKHLAKGGFKEHTEES